jgi:hypothetical protein
MTLILDQVESVADRILEDGKAVTGIDLRRRVNIIHVALIGFEGDGLFCLLRNSDFSG